MCTELPRISTSCFIFGFVIQVVTEKTMCSKDLTSNSRDYFYIKIIEIVIPVNLVTSLLFSLFYRF